MTDNSSKRRFPRARSTNTVFVTAVDGKQLDRFVKTSTVGPGGCSFGVEAGFPEGSILSLILAIRPQAFVAMARVAYRRVGEDGAVEIGCEFLDLSDDEKRLLETAVEKAKRKANPEES